MLKSYLKIAWRNLVKNKTFSFINILGLTIGITVCMMIFLFILNEFSVDHFHKQGKNIYRVMRSVDDLEEKVPYLSPPYATALLNDYPNDIQKAVRVMPSNGLISFGNTAFNEKKLYLADADFFSLFNFSLIKGDAASVLEEPASVVLTETTAKKYFGSEDPIGKIVELDKHLQLKVTGIVQDVPSNSHLDFDLVVPLSNYFKEDWFNNWRNNNLFTYALLTNKKQVEKGFPYFMDKYMGETLASFGSHWDLSLQPLEDIYFEQATSFDDVKHGSKTVVYIFISIASLILFIACVNFMNLSTVRALERSKEVGVRKVVGALRNSLIGQFIGESVLLTIISSILALGLLSLLMPFYNQLLGYTLTVSWNAWPIYVFLSVIIVVVGFLAGSYPAFLLSGFSPIQALKGKVRLGKGSSLFRQGLVIVQFSISVLLIIGIIVINNQMNYLKSKQLGYDQKQTVIVPIDNEDVYQHRNAFKSELINENDVASVSLMSGEPGGYYDIHNFKAEGKDDQIWRFRTEFADFDYVKTLGLKLIAGRDFSSDFPTDSTEATLINRTAAMKLGYTPEQAIGKWLQNTMQGNSKRRIIGVVEDFNFLSMKENMDALVISSYPDNRVAVIKLNSADAKQSIETIKKIYSKVAPVYPLDYSFLDQKFDQLYKADIRQQRILAVFSGLAIFIASLGLFGLASYTVTQRTTEIGVRKVLGSSTKNIVLLLSKDLLKPVLIAIVIALPVGYYGMNLWLQDFAYRTTLHWWFFILAAVLTLSVAAITVGLKAIRAALANPVKSLKSE